MARKLKTKKKLKLSTAKKISQTSNPQLFGNKTAIVQLERLSDAFVAKMTANGSALQPEQIMELDDEALNINSFPDEMLINIFSHLSQNELGKIARVCRKWNVLTKDPDLWKDVNVSFHKSHKSQDTVVRCFMKILPPSLFRIRLYFGEFVWENGLNFKELCMEFQRRCPDLKMLILEGAVISESLQSIIDSCTEILQNVKVTVLDSSGLSRFPTKDEIKTLDTSKIEVMDLTWSWVRSFALSALLKLPHSKNFLVLI